MKITSQLAIPSLFIHLFLLERDENKPSTTPALFPPPANLMSLFEHLPRLAKFGFSHQDYVVTQGSLCPQPQLQPSGENSKF